MLEIRRIKANEITEANKIGTIAFNGRHDFSKDEVNPPHRENFDWTYAAFENGRMVSKIVEIPYVMRFDGNDAKMSGIGGVATLPEARYGGKIRQIFNVLLAGAYNDGVVFSCLAPFSHAFYRKFGYELCCLRRETRIPTAELAKLQLSGSYELLHPGCDISDLKKIHSAYISGINHAIRRDTRPDDAMWRDFTRNDPYNTGCFIYLWRDGAGAPRSYLKYQQEKVNNSNEMEAIELAYMDKEALYAQLAFIGRFSAEIEEFEWGAPTFIDPADFIDVAWNTNQKLIPRDMTRVVNVKKALELMRRPEGEGAYVLETEDAIIPENGGRWLVEYGAGGSRVAATQKGPDIICELPALAQLVTGYRPIGEILATSRLRVEVIKNENTLNKVFTQRPQHVTEYF